MKSKIGPGMKLPEIFNALTTEQMERFQKLRPNLQRFIIEYLVDHNATQAAKRVGYQGRYIDRFAHELLEKARVILNPLVQTQTIQFAERAGITRDHWLHEIQRMAFCDARQVCPNLSEEAAAAVTSLEVAHGKDRARIDKRAALELFGEAAGFITKGKGGLAARLTMQDKDGRLIRVELVDA